MKNFYIKIKNAIKMGWWAYQNPQTLGEDVMRMLGDLLGLILRVAKEEKNYMTHIAFVNADTGEKNEIVSIWAGSGIGAEPTKRIAELIEENETLKAEIMKMGMSR